MTNFTNNFELNKAHHDSFFKKAPENDIVKGGEGSRGGKVIGHTKSGKPIYDIKDPYNTPHPDYKKYTDEDHKDASNLHDKLARETIAGDKNFVWSGESETNSKTKEKYFHHQNASAIHNRLSNPKDQLYGKAKFEGDDVEKSEDGDSLQKAFEVLGLPDAYDRIEKGGKPALVGEIRDFGGKKMIKTKMGSNSWRPYFPGGKHEHLTSGDKKEPAKEEVKTEPKAEKKEPESDKEKSPSFGKTQSGKEIRLVKEEDFKKEHNSFSEQDHKEAADMLKRSMDKRQAKYDASRSEEFPEQKQHREENRQMKQHLSNLKKPQPLTETELAYLRSYKKQIDEGRGHQLAPHEVQKWGDRFKQQYGIDFKEAAYGKK